MLLSPVSGEEPAAGATAADSGLGGGFPASSVREAPVALEGERRRHEEAPTEEAVADNYKAETRQPPVLPSPEEMTRRCRASLCARHGQRGHTSAPEDPHQRIQNRPITNRCQRKHNVPGAVMAAEEFEEVERDECGSWIPTDNTKLLSGASRTPRERSLRESTRV